MVCLTPYRTLCGVLGNLLQGEAGVLQILFSSVRHNWRDNMLRASRNPDDLSQSPFVDLPSLPKSADKKLSKPLFAVAIRIVASGKTLLERMENFFAQFETIENGITHVHGVYPFQSIIDRNTFTPGIIMNTTELSYLVHLPFS